MFHLIGVDHRVQAKAKSSEHSEEQRQFRDCLIKAIKTTIPALVAEEYSLHALGMCTERTGLEHESITESVARSLGVEHRFCDPDAAARVEIEYMEGWQISILMDPMGLSNQELEDRGLATEIGKYWPMRERFWLDQLHDVAKQEIVFVCGNAHVERFRELLHENRIDSKVFAMHIGTTPDDDERLKRALDYLEAHPELRG